MDVTFPTRCVLVNFKFFFLIFELFDWNYDIITVVELLRRAKKRNPSQYFTWQVTWMMLFIHILPRQGNLKTFSFFLGSDIDRTKNCNSDGDEGRWTKIKNLWSIKTSQKLTGEGTITKFSQAISQGDFIFQMIAVWQFLPSSSFIYSRVSIIKMTYIKFLFLFF